MVCKNDRLVVEAELSPGEHFEGFIEGAETARQRHEAIGAVEHLLLPLVHAVDYDKFCQSGEGGLRFHE